jgi:hypothetical protein
VLSKTIIDDLLRTIELSLEFELKSEIAKLVTVVPLSWALVCNNSIILFVPKVQIFKSSATILFIYRGICWSNIWL